MEAFLDVKELVAQIQVRLGYAQDRDGVLITQWIYQAVKSIGVHHVHIKETDLPIVDHQAEKPKDYVAPAHLLLYTTEGYCVQPYYVKLLNCCKTSTIYPFDPRFHVEEQEYSDRFSFSTNVEDALITKVKLIYYAVPISDGLPMVPWYCEEAAEAYCEFMSLKRMRNQYRFSQNNPVSVMELQMAEREWKNKRLAANAKMKSPRNTQELQQIGETILFRVPNTWPTELLSQVYSPL